MAMNAHHLPESRAWQTKPWPLDDPPQPPSPPADPTSTADVDSIACFRCLDTEPIAKLVVLPCENHALCEDCLRDSVRLAIREEGHYPVRCLEKEICAPISIDFIRATLEASGCQEDIDLLSRLSVKVPEYDTPPSDRIYCADSGCQIARGEARFLNSDIVGDETAVLCPECSHSTCRRCRTTVALGTIHVCNGDEYDEHIVDFIRKQVAEGEQWKWKKCPHCKLWVERIDACNHMTCFCTGQFCIICGRAWEGIQSCSHGCPHFQPPAYDDEGYETTTGFHRVTGVNRAGERPSTDQDYDNRNDYDGYDDHDPYDEDPVYGDDGFDQFDRDRDGYDRAGFDEEGRDREGRDAGGYDYDGYDVNGYDRQGFNRKMMDSDGYFDDAYDMNGFNREGISMTGMPRDMYDEDMYDPFGYDVWGYSRAGFDLELIDVEGFNVEGRDREGFLRDGFDEPAPFGFDRFHRDRRYRDRNGVSSGGYSAHHRRAEPHPSANTVWLDENRPEIEPGFYDAPDGNARHISNHEGAPELAAYMACGDGHGIHHAAYTGGSGVCYICQWHAPWFHYVCSDCDAPLCRACSHMPIDMANDRLRRAYLYPGSDSYGIERLFEDEDARSQ